MKAHTHEQEGKHPSAATYVVVYFALLLLLALTIGASFFDFGFWSVVIAVTIACAKAALIALYFMELRYSPRILALFAAAALVWFLIMIGLTANDYISRPWLPLPGE